MSLWSKPAMLRVDAARAKLLEQLFDHVPVGLALVQQGAIVTANRVLCSLLDATPEALLGRSVESLFGPAVALPTAPESTGVTLELGAVQGSPGRPLLALSITALDEAHVLSARELSAPRPPENEIAHDFNNLLLAILGSAEAALLEPRMDPAVRDGIQRIRTAALRAGELTHQLLAHSGRSHLDQSLRQPAQLSAPGVAAAGHRTVLVIDDEELICFTTRQLLELSGFRVLTATNGEQALAMFADAAVDAVLLDLTMPAMPASEVLTRLRAQRPEVKVVVMSGYDEQEIQARLGGAKIAAFLQKPFTIEELNGTLERVLDPPALNSG